MLRALNNYRLLKIFCQAQGAGLFGVADIEAIKAEFELPAVLKNKIRRGICVGVGLSSLILEDIQQEPTKLYFHHYKTVNMFLDQMTLAITQWIQERGCDAVPIPASQIIDWESQRAHLSHKKIGLLAGLGWIGRNNLLVSAKYGAQFRLATILTDMELKADVPSTKDCGRCHACVSVCPVQAIKEKPSDFDHQACFEKLKSFQRQNIVGQFICGICVKACRRQRPSIS